MNKAGNTYLVSGYSQVGSATRTLPALVPVPYSSQLIGAVATARHHGWILPTWVLFGMILLAALAVCATVTMRTRAELQNSSEQYQRLSVEINHLRRGNAALQAEVRQLQSDPSAIESAARLHLNMVRPNEIIVPIEVAKSFSKVESQSFVH